MAFFSIEIKEDVRYSILWYIRVSDYAFVQISSGKYRHISSQSEEAESILHVRVLWNVLNVGWYEDTAVFRKRQVGRLK